MSDRTSATRFYPSDATRMDTESDLYKLLIKGYQVVMDDNAWIIDVWDPVTKKLYTNDGIDIGNRSEAFAMPEPTQVRITEAETFLPGSEGEFAEGGDAWVLLTSGYQITLDGKGFIIDVWDPTTKTVRDILGNEIGSREVAYVEYYKKDVHNPVVLTMYPKDKDHFEEGTDAWHLLNAGFQITLDSRDMIIDIWNPTTGDIVDVWTTVIGHRKDPYASDQNIALAKETYETLLREIAELRREARSTRGPAKSKMNSSILSKQREYGTVLFLYGRLLRRRRSQNKTEQQKKTKSKAVQTPTD